MSRPAQSTEFPAIAVSAADARPLVEIVAGHIAAAILGGRLEPGERLGEERVARALGVSRGPVREAAGLLVSRGLLAQYPRRGFFVRALTAVEVDDLYDMRLAIERHALSRVIAGEHPREIVEVLNAQLDVMSAAARLGDLQRLAEADLAFHRLIVSHAGNARLLRHFDDLAGELLMLIGRLDMARSAPAQLVRSHRPLVAAVRRRDLAGAMAGIDLHIGDAHQVTRRSIIQNAGSTV
jgi:DNA-binding GntR family transcriptional regulator